MQKKGFRILYEPTGKQGFYSKPVRLLEAARRAGVAIAAACGGIGECGRCQVKVISGRTSHITGVEMVYLTEDEIREGFRLACCTKIYGDAEVYVPPPVVIDERRLQIESSTMEVQVSPVVEEYVVQLPEASLEDIRSDARRLSDVLLSEYGIDAQVLDTNTLTEVTSVVRESSWLVRVAVRGREIIGVTPTENHTAPLGLAVDLGTTKIALYLVDLNTGQIVGARGIQNPQASYGDDVVSRLRAVMEDAKALEHQSTAVVRAINQEVRRICQGMGTHPRRILDATVVGNTPMHHILLMLPTKHLALCPFVPATDLPVEVKARQIGLDISSGAYVYFPPPIAGFVGSDHLAMILASGITQHEGNVLTLDIGTNTEIALKTSDGGITSCSTASGPAFEGARIRCGIKAAPGAVERVTIREGDYMVGISTIADDAPIGICGSGILDAISEMLRVGIIDEKGRIRQGLPGVRQGSEGRLEFVLAEATGRRGSNDVVVTQQDIAEIQLAKGAIRTGVDTLLKRAGLTSEDINTVVVAGAFGSYMNPAAAIGIGMLPEIPVDKVVQVGNAAGAGARFMLISKVLRQRAEQLANKLGYVELAVEPYFNRQFAHSMRFPRIVDVS
ncbi:MAG: ASKHA domain-containing protein [Chloroflexota bacterium]|nr:ASKHA domain-containing protein [Chloroflexota bacterium]